MLLNASNLNSIYTGFKTAFRNAFGGVQTTWERIATRITSTTLTEEYSWLGNWPSMREWIGERSIKSLEAHKYSIRNRKFESTVAVKRDEIEDDTYGLHANQVSSMGEVAARHPDELVYSLLAAGFTTVCHDGQYFFDTDHPVNGASVSNLQSGSGNPWYLLDTSRTLKPLIFQERSKPEFESLTDTGSERVFLRDEYLFGVRSRCNVGFGFWQMAFGSKGDLDAANFNAALAAMMAFRNDEGKPLGIKPTLLVCGPTNRAAALTVIKAEKDAYGATNINRDAVEVLVVPWLT